MRGDIETRDKVATELTKPCCTLVMRSQCFVITIHISKSNKVTFYSTSVFECSPYFCGASEDFTYLGRQED